MALVTAYLGLGSNLGARLDNLQQACSLVRMQEGVLTPVRSSPVYETAPWGVTDQPDFLNCALEIGTSLDFAGARISASMGQADRDRNWAGVEPAVRPEED